MTSTDLFYDGEGVRAKKAVLNGATTYYVNENYETIDSDSDGDIDEEISYVFAGNLRIARISSVEGTMHYHKDHLGSSVVMTDEDGFEVAAETTDYRPFGSQRTVTPTADNTYKFTDQELDAESGLYNYKARLYDPVVGRFVSPDPMVSDSFDPQILNRYSYCQNNPLIFTDPSGHFALEVGPGDHSSIGKIFDNVRDRIENDRGFADENTVLGGGKYVTDSHGKIRNFDYEENKLKTYGTALTQSNYSYDEQARLMEIQINRFGATGVFGKPSVENYIGPEPLSSRVDKIQTQVEWNLRVFGMPKNVWGRWITGERFIDFTMWGAFVYAPMEIIKKIGGIDKNPIDPLKPFE